jgi:RNA polymerase sigma factor for flagellar operon FliA
MLQAHKRAVSQSRAINAARKREELIMEHVPLIKYHAYRLATQLPPNIEINDLINAGVLGLMDAVEKFEPSRGVKFKTYAELRIRGAMLDSLRELDWAPRSLRKKSKELTRASHRLQQELGREATNQNSAKRWESNSRNYSN